MNESNSLADLLNDESFLRWIRGNATLSEKNKWDQWLSEKPKHQEKVKKAKKIASMPFNNSQKKPDKAEELRKIKKALKEAEKQGIFQE